MATSAPSTLQTISQDPFTLLFSDLDGELKTTRKILDDPANGHTPGLHQVFLLTPPDDPQTLRLERPITHQPLGRGSAWTQGNRYTREEKLRRNPATTDDLAD